MNKNTVCLYDEDNIIVLLSGLKTPSRNIKTGPMLQTCIIRSDIHPTEALKSGQDELICGSCIHRLKTPARFVDVSDITSNPPGFISCVNETHKIQCIDCNLCNGSGIQKNIAIQVHGSTQKTSGSCYVNLMMDGVNAQFKSFTAGNIAMYNPAARLLADDHIRETIKGRSVRLGSYGDPAVVPMDVWINLLSLASNHTGYTHQWRDPAKQDYKSILMASVDTQQDITDATELGWRQFAVVTS
jgi:hypothetical protein